MDEAYSAEGERPPTEPDDALDRASVLFQHNPGFRQAFLRILQRCRDEAVELANLEATVEEVPGYPKLKQPPYFPIRWLHETGALEELYLDSDGRLHDGAEVAELDEDAFDDLVVAFAYRTTELGSKLAERFSPRNRLAQLLADEPDRQQTYCELLAFLTQKRSFAQIEALLRGRDVLVGTARDGIALQPSLFIDKLESVGAVAYDGGWQTTPEGKELIEG
uniref:Uncharacterized protein n=1 Tax=Muribaculaceae bacterium Z82 TaxID=2304548 RepID=A0A7C9NC87_9BACT